jgi:lipoyl(octanoyl) transferase
MNCDVDVAAFGTIVPCGITDAGVGSLSDELGRDVSVAEVLPLARDAVLAALEGTLPLSERFIERGALTS